MAIGRPGQCQPYLVAFSWPGAAAGTASSNVTPKNCLTEDAESSGGSGAPGWTWRLGSDLAGEAFAFQIFSVIS